MSLPIHGVGFWLLTLFGLLAWQTEGKYKIAHSRLAAVNGGVAGGLRGQKSKHLVVPPAPPRPEYSKEEWFELKWNYLAAEKDWPYVGSERYLNEFPKGSRKYYNSLAVFSNQDATRRMHGQVGMYRNGTQAYVPGPMPPPIEKVNKTEALLNGGFYFNLSNALPLDREPLDTRSSVCKSIEYDLSTLEDVSIIITFFNEPFSTLLRSVHSVLNRTPPPLLREIILVDDHSNLTDNIPGGVMYDYLRLLPKVKLMRLPERRGLVIARLAGAKLATAPVLVILDSHIEVNDGWLEPQLERLKQAPESIVFPQIPSIKSGDFSFAQYSGIGCRISFKWIMQEKSEGVIDVKSPDAIPSSSMAGGLFAVRADWFWELGGYDEEFSMWGAENVEMGFRAWMCGGRLECTPCARVYHIYRDGGSGYKSPPQALWKNRLRTARIWTDEFYQIAKYLITHTAVDIGPLDHMLELKERLRCKNFTWFLEHVDHVQPLNSLENIELFGEVRNVGDKNMCLDNLSNTKADLPYGVFYCHGSGGTQAFMKSGKESVIHIMSDETFCLGPKMTLVSCSNVNQDRDKWSLKDNDKIIFTGGKAPELCLELTQTVKNSRVENKLVLNPCDEANLKQRWKYGPFIKDTAFELAKFSDSYIPRKYTQ